MDLLPASGRELGLVTSDKLFDTTAMGLGFYSEPSTISYHMVSEPSNAILMQPYGPTMPLEGYKSEPDVVPSSLGLTLPSFHGIYREQQNNRHLPQPPIVASYRPHTLLQDNFKNLPDGERLPEPPDFYIALNGAPALPPPEDMNPKDGNLFPYERKLRFKGDLYTPKWVRGHGAEAQSLRSYTDEQTDSIRQLTWPDTAKFTKSYPTAEILTQYGEQRELHQRHYEMPASQEYSAVVDHEVTPRLLPEPKHDYYNTISPATVVKMRDIEQLGTLEYRGRSHKTIVTPAISASISSAGSVECKTYYTCYRRNNITCSCSYSLSPSMHGIPIQFIPMGKQTPISLRRFFICISAINGKTKQETPLLQDTTGRKEFSTPKRQQRDPGQVAKFCRIQFKNPTTEKNYHRIVVELLAEPCAESQELIRVATQASAEIVVRSRHPSAYKKKQRGEIKLEVPASLLD